MKVSKAERVADRVIAELGGQPGEPPTSRELGAWIDGGGCPAEALEAAAGSLGEMGTTFPNVEGTLAIAYGGSTRGPSACSAGGYSWNWMPRR